MESRNIFNLREATSHRRLRQWLAIGLISSVTIVVILIAIPLVIKHQAIAWMEENGAEKAEIEDVDLNLFTGQLSLLNAKVHKRGEMPLHISRLMVNMDWWPLFKKHIYVKQLDLQGVELFILQTPDTAMEFGGITPAPATNHPDQQESIPNSQQVPFLDRWGIGLQALSFENVSVHYKSAELNEHVAIKQLSITNALSWSPEQQAQVELDVLLNDHPFHWTSQARLFQKSPDMQAKFELSDIDLSHYSPIAKKMGIQGLQGKVSLNVKLEALYRENKQLQLSTGSKLHIAKFQMHQGDISIQQVNLQYLGNEQFNYPVKPGQNMLSTAAKITISDPKISHGSIRSKLETLNWEGKLKILASGNLEAPTITSIIGNLGVTGIQVDDTKSDLHLTTIDLFNADNIKLSYPGELSLASLILQKVTALQPIAKRAIESSDIAKNLALVNIEKLQLNQLNYQFDPQTLALDTLSLNDMHLFSQREGDGTFYAINALQSGNVTPTSADSDMQAKETIQPETGTTDKAKEDKLAFRFAVNKISISDDSDLHFVDNSVNPPIDTTASALKLNITSIGNTDVQTKTTLDFSASINKGNKISVTGWLTPFAEKRDADIKASIKALDLVKFSSYVSSAVGYQIKSGRINANLHASVAQDKVKAKTKIVAQRLKLQSLSKKARAESAKTIGVPLDSALSLMKDSDDNIEIEIPVNGNLSDPDFDTGKAIRSALSEAVKKGSIAYAAYALQPYGSILLGAKLLSAATSLRLESVYFDAGSANINRDAEKYLEKIAKLMKERPGIAITLCGKATPSDQVVLEQKKLHQTSKSGTSETTKPQTKPVDTKKQSMPDRHDLLSKLAKSRGDKVRNHLISRYSIAADRIFDCQPEVSEDKSSKPEVSLGL